MNNGFPLLTMMTVVQIQDLMDGGNPDEDINQSEMKLSRYYTRSLKSYGICEVVRLIRF